MDGWIGWAEGEREVWMDVRTYVCIQVYIYISCMYSMYVYMSVIL